MTEPALKILTVCSHNRTRSVMSAALLQSMLTERLDSAAVITLSSGFGPEGLPAIDDAVRAMARRNLDVSTHRSQMTTAALVDGADVILTAERDHVVKIAAISSSAFARAMTLPEFLERSAARPAPDGTDIRSWVELLTAERSAGAYLREPIPEIADPTGTSARSFEAATVAIERQCADVADALTAVLNAR